MGIILHNRRQLFTRFPLLLLIIIALAFSPAIIGIIGGWITELTTGKPCHEGNCSWMVLPWLSLISLPVGAVLLLIYLLLVLIDIISLFKKGKGSEKKN